MFIDRKKQKNKKTKKKTVKITITLTSEQYNFIKNKDINPEILLKTAIKLEKEKSYRKNVN